MQQTTESQSWVNEDGAALERLLRQRHSVRGFLARPVPAPLLTRVFELAQLAPIRSEDPTSELQSLMRISYAVFCLKKQKPSYRRRSLCRNLFTKVHSLR